MGRKTRPCIVLNKATGNPRVICELTNRNGMHNFGDPLGTSVSMMASCKGPACSPARSTVVRRWKDGFRKSAVLI